MSFNRHFRIGNYILFNDQIVKIDIHHLANIQTTYGYKMLPINDSMLYRLGFTDETDDEEVWFNSEADFYLVRREGELYQFIDHPENIIGCKIFYVHDLQNRCYSVNEVELYFVDEIPEVAQR
jgi:hypothetical protein